MREWDTCSECGAGPARGKKFAGGVCSGCRAREVAWAAANASLARLPRSRASRPAHDRDDRRSGREARTDALLSEENSHPPYLDTVQLGYLSVSGVPTYFAGAVDELCIFNRALTADEVRQLATNP